MATRVIDDTKLNNIAVAIQAKDSGGQMTVDEMPTRIVNIPSGGATLIPKTITENGVYNATDDNADGYDVVTVDVPQDFYKKVIELASGTISYFKNSEIINIPNNFFSAQTQLSFISLPNLETIGNYNGYTCNKLKYINSGKIRRLSLAYVWQAISCKTLVLTVKQVCALTSINNNSGVGKGITVVYVPDLDEYSVNLVEQYKNATNWSSYASQIKGFSEAPIYDNSVTYSIGDVCRYNNKFYAYAKEDLKSSTGNPPTGTTADNNYWEYVADIEVI